VLTYAHRYPEARAEFQKVLERDPGFWPAHFKLSQFYATTGDFANAVRELRKLPEAQVIQVPENADGYQRLALGLSGTDRTFAAAIAYAASGNHDKALDFLEQGYANGDSEVIQAIRYPALDPLRSEPRYKDLVRKLGLPE